MTDWHSKLLGDVVELKRGYDLPAATRREGSVPVVSSSGRTGWHDEAKVSGPGVVTGRYGTLGEVFYVEEDFWPLNTALYVKDFKGNDPRFVAALLASLDLANNDVAAAVPGVNRNYLHLLPVRVPDPPVQRQIGETLARVDSLLANYARQTTLLSEAMQLTYDQRFGTRHMTRAAAPSDRQLPAGWQVRPVKDALQLHYGKSLRKNDRRGGDVAVVGSSGIVGWHDVALTPGPSIVVGRKGNMGSVSWIDADAWPIDTTYFVSTDLPLSFVYHQLLELDFVDSHAAVPGLSRDQAYSLSFVVPPEGELLEFDALVQPMLAQRAALVAAERILARLRLEILPRLVSGKLDVQGTDP